MYDEQGREGFVVFFFFRGILVYVEGRRCLFLRRKNSKCLD